MIHGYGPWPCVGRRAVASTGTRWWVIRSTADWLVVNKAASARVVRLVRSWISTSSTRMGRGMR
ncbi:MAG TPA: hypothetical protein VF299_11100 [Mycobacterium sp.]